MQIDLGILVPILALSIPLVAIIGRHIVRPLAEALTRAPAAGHEMANAEARRELEELRDRLDGLEKALSRVEEEQSFQRALQTGGRLDGPHDALPTPGKAPRV